ncbi:hypothetical protein CHLRE_01g025900v5 [Chlamydomonas reinhardtii]|uniref:RCC1-like domain-containing protein n=1 Tax=Chlamydomonas reinhardtii TaxID=3055 RepID=A0A2K3E6F1_CHLRE|nr:uncharacterized protein CHLRE_01g025900v5 [Chlamydomonas reinhardtii]PNW88356.1 hypothetical protein CHLRE_01g025900v5 [Chlamydomonas reinhardtii]
MSKLPLTRVLAVFGSGTDGRLGLGFPITSQLYPRIVASLAGYSIKQVSCGGAHTAVVTDDGSLFTFGLNDWGQLGHSREDKFVAAPIEVTLPDPVKAVAAGGFHTLALTTAGELWAWGMSGEGQLGIGQPTEGRQLEPRMVRSMTGSGLVAVAAGDHHSAALTADGQVYTWGRGDHGALGHGSVQGHVPVELVPKRVRGLAGVRVAALTAAPYATGAVDGEGQAFAWGHGTGWQLGTGRNTSELTPVKLDLLPGGVTSLALGQLHSLAVVGDGRAVVFGSDETGSLGGGTDTLRSRVARRPQPVPGLPLVSQAAVGWKHSLAVGRDGRLFSWGWSGAMGQGTFTDYGGGQLGHGDDQDRWAPEPVLRLHTSRHRYLDLRAPHVKSRPWRVLAAAAGRNHSAAVVELPLDVRDLAD